jgi:hypothetical protein
LESLNTLNIPHLRFWQMNLIFCILGWPRPEMVFRFISFNSVLHDSQIGIKRKASDSRTTTFGSPLPRFAGEAFWPAGTAIFPGSGKPAARPWRTGGSKKKSSWCF